MYSETIQDPLLVSKVAKREWTSGRLGIGTQEGRKHSP
jgi:hypothetical protein